MTSKLVKNILSQAKHVYLRETRAKAATCSRAFVDARVQPIYGGTNEIMKELIARTVDGR